MSHRLLRRAAALLAAISALSAVAAASDKPVLAGSSYQFCHQPGMWAEAAAPYCELLDGMPTGTCPGLEASCEGATPITPYDGWEWLYNYFNGETTGEDPEIAGAPNEPRERQQWSGCDQTPKAKTSWLTTALQWLCAGLVALLVLVIARVVWAVIDARRAPEPVRARVIAAPQQIADALDDVPDLPSADLLASAMQALRRNAPGEAVILARGAALRHLGERGRLRLHRARTDREYLNDLRNDSAVNEPLSALLAAVETHKWGGRAVDVPQAESAIAAARRIITASVALWLALGAIDAQAQVIDRYGPIGDAALRDLLVADGHHATWRMRRFSDLDDKTDLLIVDISGVAPSTAAWEQIRAWVAEGHIAIVAGNTGSAWPELGAWTAADGKLTDAMVFDAEPLDGYARPPRLPNGFSAYFAPEAETEARPIVVARWRDRADAYAPVIVEVSIGDGLLVAIADARILYNGSFVDVSNEAFVKSLVAGSLAWNPTPEEERAARIQLATLIAARASRNNPFGGGATENPTAALYRAGLLPFVIQLLLLWAVLALRAGWRFGPVLRDQRDQRADFVEHVVALGDRWRRSRASGYAARAVARYLLGRHGQAGLAVLARRTGQPEATSRAFVTGVEQLAERDEVLASPTDDLKQMETMWKTTQRH